MAKKNTIPATKSPKPASAKGDAARTEKARKAALAEVRARIDDAAPPTGDVAPTAAPASGTPEAPTPDAGQQTPPSGKARGKGSKKAKESAAAKPAKEPKAKRLSALDAAAQVLAKAAKPMSATELVEQMATQGLWSSPNGRTPSATLYAAMIREAAAKGSESRFKKVDRGMFEYVGK
ncbi:MAG: HTH domain-containing protein [Phycisphaerales bacterium]|nr:HTH domain-containing protein [Phycisphaerales bacterium]